MEARALLERFPKSPSASQARLLVANSFEMEGKHQEAIAAYQDLIAHANGPDLTSRAQLAMAKQLELTGNDAQALETLLACLQTHSDPLLIQHEIAKLQRKMAETKRLATEPDAFDRGASAGKRSRKAAKGASE
jgi:hypothetical protein